MRGRGSDDGAGGRLHDGRESILGPEIGSGTRAASGRAVAPSPGTADPPTGSAARRDPRDRSHRSGRTARSCRPRSRCRRSRPSERLATQGSRGLPPIPGRRRPGACHGAPRSAGAKLRPSTGCPGPTPARSAIVGARSTLEISPGTSCATAPGTLAANGVRMHSSYCATLPSDPVLAEREPVVGEEQDHRVLQLAARLGAARRSARSASSTPSSVSASCRRSSMNPARSTASTCRSFRTHAGLSETLRSTRRSATSGAEHPRTRRRGGSAGSTEDAARSSRSTGRTADRSARSAGSRRRGRRTGRWRTWRAQSLVCMATPWSTNPKFEYVVIAAVLRLTTQRSHPGGMYGPAPERVSVEVLADQPGEVAGPVEPRGDRLRLVEPRAVVVRPDVRVPAVPAGQDRRARRTAERCLDERVREPQPMPVRDPRTCDCSHGSAGGCDGSVSND